MNLKLIVAALFRLGVKQARITSAFSWDESRLFLCYLGAMFMHCTRRTLTLHRAWYHVRHCRISGYGNSANLFKVAQRAFRHCDCGVL